MKDKKEKILLIKGMVLDKCQLYSYMEKVASHHNLQTFSDAKTYPIPRLKENFKWITKTYQLLNEQIKLGMGIYPAAEWLLDNYYVIEEMTKTVIQDLDIKKYKKFQGIADGPYKGYARIYVLASEIVAYTDNKIDDENLKLAIEAYQNKKTLNMDEIWNLSFFLIIAIIENIRQICERIYSSQLQKYKVENIVERLVEKKEIKNQMFTNKEAEETLPLSFKEMKYPFIEYMSYKLKKYGKQGLPYLNILEEQVEKMGMTISEVIQKEHFQIALRKSIYRKLYHKYKRNFKSKFSRHF